jgi:hypothetical protein
MTKAQCAFSALGTSMPAGYQVAQCSNASTHLAGGVPFCDDHRHMSRCACTHAPEQHVVGCGVMGCPCKAGPGREDHETQSDAAGPCEDCGTTHGDRSPCPCCGKVFCLSCAESPYAFCCDGVAPPPNPPPDVPLTNCPRCGREEPDFDGFGILAHTKPAYINGCGYCAHPSRDNGVCGICGDIRP